MSQRLEFVEAVVHRAPGQSIREVCRRTGISERVGHKWLARFTAGGPAALADRSHAPQVPAHQVPRAIVDAVIALRAVQPEWGARKLRDVLQREQPTVPWPAPSTITTLLKRAGLVRPRRRSRRERAAWAHTALTPPHAPNDVWAADFKGEFRLARGPYCYPLTITDLSSRYVLTVTALASTASEPAAAQFRQTFAAYGLPRVIRTDNGVPFGAPLALGGLSALAVWWIRLGIRPERIERGQPQQNGVHERMHRTLKAEATRPPSATAQAQQERFDRWRRTFNERRPHEALANTPPADHYQASPRPLPQRLPMLAYPAAVELRRVTSSGHIKWRSVQIFLSTTLIGEYVSLRETGDDEWTIAFGPLTLGIYSAHTLAFHEALAWPLDSP
jgi:transposase InsO family protein